MSVTTNLVIHFVYTSYCRHRMAPRSSRYEMEDFLGYRRDNNKDFYLVSWVGYSQESNSWEPRTNITNPSRETRDKMKKIKAQYMCSDESPEGAASVCADQSQRSNRKRGASAPTPPTSTTRYIHECDVVAESLTTNNSKHDDSKDRNSRPRCVKVVHLKKKDGCLFVYAQMENFTSEDNKHQIFPLEAFRLIHPQQLIDYFIRRLQIVSSCPIENDMTTKQTNHHNNNNNSSIQQSGNTDRYNNNKHNNNNNIDKQEDNNIENKSTENTANVRNHH
eukprot:GHVS01041241.1.p1 GENE.GHVS01041241.1~~GHVS01041241.1.p1  ORF type:complete len:277 (-),score=60.38 GHVS01041241.1:628-1458(-)